MTPIKKLFTDISDDDLLTGIREIKELVSTGVLCDGIVREYVRKLNEITNNMSGTDIDMATNNFIYEAAFRWLKEKTK